MVSSQQRASTKSTRFPRLMASSKWNSSRALLLLAMLFVALPLVVDANRSAHSHAHHHHSSGNNQQQQQNKSEQQGLPSSGSNNEVSAASEQRIEDSPISEESSLEGRGKELFQQYLSRGMFTCSSKYVGVLQKLNKLIASAHAEFTKCQRMADKADRSGQSAEKARKLAAQLEMINELFDD